MWSLCFSCILAMFLSPARRGRGILVTPGFRQASSVTFFRNAKTQKLFFWNFNITFLVSWGCARDFLDATKIQNGRHRSTSIFLWAQKLFKFYNLIPHNMEMCRPLGDFLKVLLKFKIAATDQLQFFVGANTQKLKVGFYSNFAITFPAIWRCAGDFLRFYWNSKCPPWMNLIIFGGRKKLKSEIIHILQSHHPPSVNVQVILLKFKIATTSRLFKYLWPQKIMAGDDIANGFRPLVFMSLGSFHTPHGDTRIIASWLDSTQWRQRFYPIKIDLTCLSSRLSHNKPGYHCTGFACCWHTRLVSAEFCECCVVLDYSGQTRNFEPILTNIGLNVDCRLRRWSNTKPILIQLFDVFLVFLYPSQFMTRITDIYI